MRGMVKGVAVEGGLARMPGQRTSGHVPGRQAGRDARPAWDDATARVRVAAAWA